MVLKKLFLDLLDKKHNPHKKKKNIFLSFIDIFSRKFIILQLYCTPTFSCLIAV